MRIVLYQFKVVLVVFSCSVDYLRTHPPPPVKCMHDDDSIHQLVLSFGRVLQVKNGGVLNVAEGATATFLGTAEFNENYVTEKYLGPVSCGENCSRTGRGLSYIVKKGGAIHNKVPHFTTRSCRLKPGFS